MLIQVQDGKQNFGHVEHGEIMKLMEFFGSHSLDSKKEESNSSIPIDELFEFILNSDQTFKSHYFNIAETFNEKKSFSNEEIIEYFMPMVKQGCKEFYDKNKLTGKLGKVFNKDLREKLCNKLYDHYHNDLKKYSYFN